MNDMEFQDVVRKRRMVRNYDSSPIGSDQLDRLLDNALRAPSAGFSQGWAFLVLTTPDDLDRFWASTTPEKSARLASSWLLGMRTAPVIIVPLSCKAEYLRRYSQSDKGWTDQSEDRWPIPYWHVDTGMAALLILQTVVDEGLGACFFGIPPETIPKFNEEFGVPEEYTPIGAITVGRRLADASIGGSASRRPRKSTDEVVHRGSW